LETFSEVCADADRRKQKAKKKKKKWKSGRRVEISIFRFLLSAFHFN
jgi:hypothetical protein